LDMMGMVGEKAPEELIGGDEKRGLVLDEN
jgi:hypothetical protein